MPNQVLSADDVVSVTPATPVKTAPQKQVAHDSPPAQKSWFDQNAPTPQLKAAPAATKAAPNKGVRHIGDLKPEEWDAIGRKIVPSGNSPVVAGLEAATGLDPTGVLPGSLEAAKGVKQTATAAANLDPKKAAGGVHRTVSGVFDAATPLMAGGLLNAPLKTARTLAAAMVSQSAVEKGLEYLGLPKEYASVVGDAAGIIAGAKAHGSTPEAKAAAKEEIKAKVEPVLKERAASTRPESQPPKVESGKPATRLPVSSNVRPEEGERSGRMNMTRIKEGAPGIAIESPEPEALPRLKRLVSRDESGKPNGYLQFYLDDDLKGVAPKEHGLYPEVYVDPSARRTGVATKLYDEAARLGHDLSGISGTETTPNGAAFLNARNGYNGLVEVAPKSQPAGEVSRGTISDVNNNKPAAEVSGGGKIIKDHPVFKAGVAYGARTKTKLARGYKVNVRYALVDADDLQTSHDHNTFEENDNYKQSIQPRDRERAGYQQQVKDIAKSLDPAQVAHNYMASDGAPIIGDDGLVESGNGRSMALKRIYDSDPAKAAEYAEYLRDNAETFGLDPETIGGLKKPVLVRVRSELPEGIQRADFAKHANEDLKEGMGAVEQAKVDSEALTPELMAMFDPSEDGKINTAANREFVRKFTDAVVGPGKKNIFMMDDGSISGPGIQRIRNAIFAKAFGNSSALDKLAEDPNDNTKTVTNGLVSVAPKFASINAAIENGDLYDLNPAPSISRAVSRLASLRSQKLSIQDFLRQGDMLGIDPVEHKILDIFDRHKRSAKRISTLFGYYADTVEAIGSPKQAGMFGGEPPTILEILQAADDKVAAEQAELDKQEEAQNAAKNNGAVPEEQAGSSEENKAVDGQVAPAEEPAKPA